MASVEESVTSQCYNWKVAYIEESGEAGNGGVGDSVTCAGLVSGVDEQSPIVCVGGMNGRKVIFVDVLSGEALSEIAVGSQSMSSSSAAAIGSSCCWENLELVLVQEAVPPIVYVSPRPVELEAERW